MKRKTVMPRLQRNPKRPSAIRRRTLAGTTTCIGATLAALAVATAAADQPVADKKAAMFSEAEAYERFMGRWSERLAPLFVAFFEARDRDDILDVGSGTGSLSLAIANATQTGRIVGIDLAEEYVAYATERTKSRRVQYEVGDAQKMRFPDGSFDRTAALLVVNFIPDRRRAVREMMRVTRTGGVVAACVWDYSEAMEMLRFFWDEAVALDPTAEPRDERHMPLSKQGELTALWTEEGLERVEERELIISLEFESFDDYWKPFLDGQGPAGAYVASLSAARQKELAERLRRRLLGDRQDGPITLKARAWAAKGTVPTR